MHTTLGRAMKGRSTKRQGGFLRSDASHGAAGGEEASGASSKRIKERLFLCPGITSRKGSLTTLRTILFLIIEEKEA